MVGIAIYEERIVQASDVDAGFRGYFYCVGCNEKLVFVKASDNHVSYFRHYPDSKCDIRNYSSNSNKMSDFHQNWQMCFPKECIEVKMDNHRADVFVEGKIIEIQHSPISDETIKEREEFYNQRGELMWIFDTKAEILEKIILDKEEYRLRYLNRSDFYGARNVYLDLGGSYLFRVTSVDAGYVRARRINKLVFVKELGIEHAPVGADGNEIVYDFTKMLEYGNRVSGLFRSLVWRKVDPTYWKNEKSFLWHGEKLAEASGKNEEVFDMWLKWVTGQKPRFTTRIKFGEHRGTLYHELPISYINWLAQRPGREIKEISMLVFFDRQNLINEWEYNF